MEGCFMFQWEGGELLFRLGGSFLSGGISFGGGGQGFEKNRKIWERPPSPHAPHNGKPCLLDHTLKS